tara:strand:+ start:233 stop:724 length:492 start_codon:yes stop_codon:yes gene_type:complete
MLMAVTGIPEARAREYIFSTPLLHGLSYRLVNHDSPLLKKKLAHCRDYLEKAIDKSNCEDLFNAEDLIKRVLNKQSDFWISIDKDDNIKGSLIIGFGEMPRAKGINAEAIAGNFKFEVLVPMLEKYYKNLGFKFFEMTGRKGWEKVMEPLGYDFKSITIRKKL